MLVLLQKNDIITGAVVLPDYWLRIIEAFDGTNETDLVINGEVHLQEGKLYFNDVQMDCTAAELNTLHNRTPGTVEALKPIIPDLSKKIDELYIANLTVDSLTNNSGQGAAALAGGTIYSYLNFK
jgi:hypothetical protein